MSNESICALYAKAKKDMSIAISSVMSSYRLPLFMADGIMSSILCEIKSNAYNELVEDYERCIKDGDQDNNEK